MILLFYNRPGRPVPWKHNPPKSGDAVEREFSDELRDARFPPGWYLLPSFAAVLFATTALVMLA